MKLLEEDPSFTQEFSSMGCLYFYHKLQGYHGKIAKEFAINFTGKKYKVGMLNFPVSPNTTVVLHKSLGLEKCGLKCIIFSCRIVMSFLRKRIEGLI